MPTQPVFKPLIAALALTLVGCATNPPGNDGQQPRAKREHWQPKPEVYESYTVNQPDPVQVQVGRYSFIPAKPAPEQLNPLLTVIDVEIPGTIVTVADTAKYLLQFSGYHLTPTARPSLFEQTLLKSPIPDVHRHFQQVVLRDALVALGGNGFRLLVDPVNRLVAYERNPNYPGWEAP
jgi:conjugative transfer region protein (TIGR03748 family)